MQVVPSCAASCYVARTRTRPDRTQYSLKETRHGTSTSRTALARRKAQENALSATLKTRHLTMMSIAGVIGGSLFVGSGSIVHSAGPAAVLAYLAGGIVVVFIMRMLGEMATANPDTGSFSTYADRAIGRWAGSPSAGCTGATGRC